MRVQPVVEAAVKSPRLTPFVIVTMALIACVSESMTDTVLKTALVWLWFIV